MMEYVRAVVACKQREGVGGGVGVAARNKSNTLRIGTCHATRGTCEAAWRITYQTVPKCAKGKAGGREVERVGRWHYRQL